MRELFIRYLKNKGYSEKTKTGNPSTVYDYAKRVEKILKNENISYYELANDISNIIQKYDLGGEKQHIGEQSHKAVINSLKRFKEFIDENKEKNN